MNKNLRDTNEILREISFLTLYYSVNFTSTLIILPPKTFVLDTAVDTQWPTDSIVV